jgi:adenosylcobinamide kinase/adenosylcobinamide-phosphate guanylyltransferase
MEKQFTFILGGARSGKSTHALRLATAYQQDVLFLATAEPFDGEMAEKIGRHRAERPVTWRTLEEPRAVARALAAAQPAPVVMLDCVTLWVSNLLLAEGATWESAVAELDALLAWYRAAQSHLIVVSNEVGLGLVPPDAVSRVYREWLGWFNQRFAAQADRVYLMVAGLAIDVKALAAPSAGGIEDSF